MDCSRPGSSVHGILQARIQEWVACPPPRDLPDPGIKPASLTSPALAGGFFTTSATWEAQREALPALDSQLDHGVGGSRVKASHLPFSRLLLSYRQGGVCCSLLPLLLIVHTLGGLYLGPTHPRTSWAGRRWLPWSLCLSEASTPAAGRAGAGRAQRGAVETRPPLIQPETLDFVDSLRMHTWSPFPGALWFGGMAPLTARFKKERPIKFTNA